MGEATQKLLGIIGLGILFLTLIYFTGEREEGHGLAGNLMQTAVSPLQGFASEIGSQSFDFFYFLFNYDEIISEKRALEEELSAEANLRYQLKELQKENQRLREMLGFQEQVEHELLPAEVIARDPSTWFETITINKGYADGVEQDMAVVTSRGLIGNIYQVSRSSSRVLLLTDTRRAVSALVQRSREPGFVGVVEGSPEKRGYLRMVNLPSEANIQIGDTIVSSGLGGIFPKGLVIGRVMEVETDHYGLLKQALLSPEADFNRLEEVFVVISSPVEEEVVDDNNENIEPNEEEKTNSE